MLLQAAWKTRNAAVLRQEISVGDWEAAPSASASCWLPHPLLQLLLLLHVLQHQRLSIYNASNYVPIATSCFACTRTADQSGYII